MRAIYFIWTLLWILGSFLNQAESLSVNETSKNVTLVYPENDNSIVDRENNSRIIYRIILPRHSGAEPKLFYVFPEETTTDESDETTTDGETEMTSTTASRNIMEIASGLESGEPDRIYTDIDMEMMMDSSTKTVDILLETNTYNSDEQLLSTATQLIMMNLTGRTHTVRQATETFENNEVDQTNELQTTIEPKTNELEATSEPKTKELEATSEPKTKELEATSEPKTQESTATSEPKTMALQATPEPKAKELQATSEPKAKELEATSEPKAKELQATSEPKAKELKATSEPKAKELQATSEPKAKELQATSEPKDKELQSAIEPKTELKPKILPKKLLRSARNKLKAAKNIESNVLTAKNTTSIENSLNITSKRATLLRQPPKSINFIQNVLVHNKTRQAEKKPANDTVKIITTPNPLGGKTRLFVYAPLIANQNARPIRTMTTPRTPEFISTEWNSFKLESLKPIKKSFERGQKKFVSNSH